MQFCFFFDTKRLQLLIFKMITIFAYFFAYFTLAGIVFNALIVLCSCSEDA